jgi:putative redox protein
MVEIQIAYEGQLHCSATHAPSGTRLTTDAPKDNMGLGESFSPTDLVATALGTCILTTMAIAAQRRGIALNGATARVTKEMTTTPPRRLGRLTVEIVMSQDLPEEERTRLEHAANACPVHKSLHPDVEIPITFRWGKGPG